MAEKIYKIQIQKIQMGNNKFLFTETEDTDGQS